MAFSCWGTQLGLNDPKERNQRYIPLTSLSSLPSSLELPTGLLNREPKGKGGHWCHPFKSVSWTERRVKLCVKRMGLERQMAAMWFVSSEEKGNSSIKQININMEEGGPWKKKANKDISLSRSNPMVSCKGHEKYVSPHSSYPTLCMCVCNTGKFVCSHLWYLL